MEKNRVISRSIIVDPVYQKINNKRFKNHLQAIKTSQSAINLQKSKQKDEGEQMALKISRYKKTKVKTNENIDPVLLQNKALIKRMQNIDKRKSQSIIVSSFQSHNQKNQQNQKKRIKEQNFKHFNKLQILRESVITKKQLKRQYLEVENLIMHARKIKETIKKCKKSRNKILFQSRSQKQAILIQNNVKQKQIKVEN